MINQNQNPVSWTTLLYELADAHEHLGSIVDQMSSTGRIDDEDFRIQLGHVFAHLNRAWNGRDDSEPLPDSLHTERSQFPSDLQPVG